MKSIFTPRTPHSLSRSNRSKSFSTVSHVSQRMTPTPRIARVLGPPFVHDDVGNAEAGGEVDEVFVGRGVESGHEIDVGAVGRRGVPELPTDLPRLDPRRVAECARLGQPGRHRGFDQVAVLVREDEITPREGPFARRGGDAAGLFEDAYAPVARLLGAERHFGEDAPHAVGAVARQEEAGIVREGGFADEDFVAPFRVEQRREHGQPAGRAPRAGSDLLVGLLVAGPETAGLLQDRRRGVRQAEGELLAEHLDGALRVGEETVGHAVVVGPELHGPVAAEVEPQRIAAVADFGELVSHGGAERAVDRAAPVAHEAERARRAAAVEPQAQAALFQQRDSVAADGVGDPFSDVDREGYPPVGRFEFEVLGRQRGAPEQSEQDETGFFHTGSWFESFHKVAAGRSFPACGI